MMTKLLRARSVAGTRARCSALLLGTSVVALAAREASAQLAKSGVVAPPSAPLPPPAASATPASPAITQSVTNASVDDMRRGGQVAVNGTLAGIPLLNGFRFRFSNGDHELRQVGVVADGASSAVMTFFDKNGDDPFSAQATWVVLNGGATRATVLAAGAGFMDVPLTPRPPNTRLVLTGFSLFRNDDFNVRMVGIWLDEARNVARVSFFDDQGGAANGAVPLGDAGWEFGKWPGAQNRGTKARVVTSVAAAVNEMRAIKDAAPNGFRPYGVRIQYAFIPTSVVEGDDYFTGSTRVPASGKVFPSRGALQGFEFVFDNSDHHLLDFGIMPPLAGSVVRSKAPSNEFVAFQDKNRDDPMRWAVRFVKLKP
jgi:hypothetical protein